MEFDVPLPLAAPSWVMPGTMAENARFLAGKVEEVALCCFEAVTSAVMPEVELPFALTALPLRWHVHLPTDLPFAPHSLGLHGSMSDGESAATAALAVWNRVAFLRPHLAVLHLPPPEADPTWLDDFVRIWRQKRLAPHLLAVENVFLASPVFWEGEVERLGLSLCLDMGHAMAYGQEDILDRANLMARVRLIHWSAPGEHAASAHNFMAGSANGGVPADRHLPLTEWSPQQRHVAERALRHLPPRVTHLVEVFQWEGVVRSWPVLRSLSGWRGA